MTKRIDSYPNEQEILVTAETVQAFPSQTSPSAPTIAYGVPTTPTKTNNDNVKPRPQPTQSNTARPSITTTTVTHIPPPPTSSSSSPQSCNIRPPDLAEMKRHRVRSQTLMGWVGGAVGCVVLFIPGAIIGAIAGNKITKHVMKKEERQAQEEYEFKVAQISNCGGNQQ